MSTHASPADPIEAQRVAEACRDLMWRDDRASKALGMQVLAIGPGSATLAMTVREDMLNGHDICHGGFVTLLADSCFAFACNGYNQRTVGQQASITYLAPGRVGDRLTAACREVSRQGRSGVYDVRVTNQDGTHIAEFRGHSRTVKGTHLPVDG